MPTGPETSGSTPHGAERPPVIHEGLPTQLPDIDPEETAEWVGSLDQMVDDRGRARARYVMLRLLERAREKQVGVPALRSTDFINTIPPEREPWFPGNEAIERRIRAFIRWNAAVMVSRANRPGLGVGGHIATYQSAASLYEVGFNHFFRGKGHPGGGDQIYFQGHAAPGIYARSYLEGRLTEEQLDRFRQERSHGAGQRPVVLPAPAAHAELLGVPDGLDGARRDQLHLPGALQPLPPPPRHQGHQRPARVGLPRRRRDGRAGVARRHRPRGPRGARQPDVRHQLQPAAARRAGPRQRQDHPGAGVLLPRRRLERHQGRVGTPVGRPPRPRLRRRARQPDEPHAGRRVPDAVGRVRCLQPRALLRRRPAAGQDGRAPHRRADRASPPRRPRLPQGVRGVRRGGGAHRPADRHPRPHHQGLAARVVPGPQRDPPDEEAHQGRPQGFRDRLAHPDLRRADRRRRPRAVLPPGHRQRGDPVHEGAPRRARRIDPVAQGRPDSAQAARRRRLRPAQAGLGQAADRHHDGVRPAAARPHEGPGDRPAHRADRARRVPHVRHGLDVPVRQDLQPARPDVRVGRPQAAAGLQGVRAAVSSCTRASARPAPWPRRSRPAARTPRRASR